MNVSSNNVLGEKKKIASNNSATVILKMISHHENTPI